MKTRCGVEVEVVTNEVCGDLLLALVFAQFGLNVHQHPKFKDPLCLTIK